MQTKDVCSRQQKFGNEFEVKRFGVVPTSSRMQLTQLSSEVGPESTDKQSKNWQVDTSIAILTEVLDT